MKKGRILLGCVLILVICSSTLFGTIGGYLGGRFLNSGGVGQTLQNITNSNVQVVHEESEVISAVENSTNSVVSIVITKDVPKYENINSPLGSDFGFTIPQKKQVGTEQQEVGAGTGFIISTDGMIITNRHVVDDETASYTAIFNDGTKKEAKVLARDTLLDIAFLKIDGADYKPIPLGSSAQLKSGQSVIAIGNALGEFSNTISTGVISGLGRNIQATDQDGGNAETLSDIIQTDASINFGNSGGPLLDIKGNVIGVNVARSSDGENIGFAIPIDVVKDLIDMLNTTGKIERPVLGVRYIPVDATFKAQNNIPYDYGAYISGNTQNQTLGVVPGSPADKAGLKDGDIILEVNGKRVDDANPLSNLIQSFKIDDTITLKIYTKGAEQDIQVKLERFEIPTN
ncbi:MAG: trypsin-like peptidase domain-containing protein [Candidatus Dojkabacteria bacterium]